MKLIRLGILEEAKLNYPEAAKKIDVWRDLMEENDYKNPNEIKNAFSGVDFVGKGQTIFNIKGNKFRLLAFIDYQKGIVMPMKFDNHANYNKWDL